MQRLNELLQLDPTSQQARHIIRESQRTGKVNAKYSRTYNNNNIITFDTETTSLYWQGDKCSFVYISMLCINGHTFYTRNFSDIKTFLDTYDTPGTMNIIYVHNLAFDFSFLQNIIPFDTVFARRAHRPIFARYKSWEFRCSYFLSQMSLKNVCKSYKLPARKLVDGLDYGRIRHTQTPLSPIELKYCEIDVIALYEYIKYMMNEYGGYREIPHLSASRGHSTKYYHAHKTIYIYNKTKQQM